MMRRHNVSCAILRPLSLTQSCDAPFPAHSTRGAAASQAASAEASPPADSAPATQSTAPAILASHQRRLLRVVSAGALLLLVFGVSWVIRWWTNGLAAHLLLGLADGGAVFVYALCRHWARRGRLARAGLGAATVLLAVGVVQAVALPAMFVGVVLYPSLALAIAFPYASRPQFQRFCLLAAITTLLLFAAQLPAPVLPQPDAGSARVDNLLGALVLILFSLALCWQSHHRLADAIAELHTTNAALQAAQATLQKDVSERTATAAALAVAKEAAEAANRAKSTFLMTMSHELRTPLQAIVGYSQLLQREAELGLPLTLAADLERIHSASRQLLSLIGGVLDLAKIEAGTTEVVRERFALADLLAEVVDTSAPLVAHNDNTLRVEGMSTALVLDTDRGKLNQILLNLVANAAKFTHGGHITLDVASVATATGPLVRFQVIDTGVGIALTDLATIFAEFVQVGDATQRSGGTGLGLALCQRLCRLLGGTIMVASVVGEGSTFQVQLPLQHPLSANDAAEVTTNTVVSPPLLHSSGAGADAALPIHR